MRRFWNWWWWYNLMHVPKTSELYPSKLWMLWYTNYISVKSKREGERYNLGMFLVVYCATTCNPLTQVPVWLCNSDLDPTVSEEAEERQPALGPGAQTPRQRLILACQHSRSSRDATRSWTRVTGTSEWASCIDPGRALQVISLSVSRWDSHVPDALGMSISLWLLRIMSGSSSALRIPWGKKENTKSRGARRSTALSNGELEKLTAKGTQRSSQLPQVTESVASW